MDVGSSKGTAGGSGRGDRGAIKETAKVNLVRIVSVLYIRYIVNGYYDEYSRK